MNFKEFIKNGLLDEMAARFRDENLAELLLVEIDFPTARRPPFPTDGNTLRYWQNICTQIDDGAINAGDDLQPLVNAAHARFPGNRIFNRYLVQADADGHEEASTAEQRPNIPEGGATAQRESQDLFVNVLIENWNGVQDLINQARTIAHRLGMPPDTVQLGLANAEGILLNLTGPWTMEQAVPLAQALEALPQAIRQGVRTNVATSNYQDYLISRLFVEGPDQAKFEINDIRASTPLRDIAEGVIGTQYSEEMNVQGRGIQGREVVIDRINANGSTERLDPDQSLHEQNIREDENLMVSPESTAGVHPQVRDDALARARHQVVAFSRSHPGFGIAANAHHAPTEYIFRFEALGFAPPATPDGPPVPINRHEVYLLLRSEFPMKAPLVFWQSPIFHPNVDPDRNIVCLGPLGINYKPGLDFAELCQLLIDIASYQNYASEAENCLNRVAQAWALTEDGQIAIEQRGGKSLLRKFVHTLRTPRPLRINRV